MKALKRKNCDNNITDKLIGLTFKGNLEYYNTIESNLDLAEKYFFEFSDCKEKDKYKKISKVIYYCEIDPQYNFYYLKY